MGRAVDVPVLREMATRDAHVAVDPGHRIVVVDTAACAGVPEQFDRTGCQAAGKCCMRAKPRPLLVARQFIALSDSACFVAYAEQQLACRGERRRCLCHLDLLRGIATDLLAGSQRGPLARALEIELQASLGDTQAGGADIDAENTVARRAIEGILVERIAGRRSALEMLDRQGAMLRNEDVGNDDVVAGGALQADGSPGVDDLDLAGRQGEIAVSLDVAVVDEGGKQAPVAGIAPADQRPTASQHIPAIDATRPAPGGNEDAAHKAGRILAPYVVLPL